MLGSKMLFFDYCRLHLLGDYHKYNYKIISFAFFRHGSLIFLRHFVTRAEHTVERPLCIGGFICNYF
jgi:hypothetical protein